MFPSDLTDDAKATLLLCGSFPGGEDVRPLSPREFGELLKWLQENGVRPGELVRPGGEDLARSAKPTGIDTERLVQLLRRGAVMAFSVEKWLSKGLWVATRTDSHYPRRLASRLGALAPPILYGAGPYGNLDEPALAVVGSRNVDPEGFDYSREVGGHCARSGITVVSGGARGVDQSAMAGALSENGLAVGVLSDGLLRAAVSQFFREALCEERLTLLSACHPETGFNVGNAMSRNKSIYALSDYALVVSADKGKGGTWSGATEELNRTGGVLVYVRSEGSPPEGNVALLRLGAHPFPERPWNKPFGELLLPKEESKASPENIQLSLFEEGTGAARKDANRVAETPNAAYGSTKEPSEKVTRRKGKGRTGGTNTRTGTSLGKDARKK